jgi:hypothetical protein
VPRPATGQTPVQHFRVPADDWRDFNDAAGGKGAEVLRAFIRWYVRRRGAKQVKRPDSPEHVT